jgi:enoyl-CoA hydratase/carnithine racemase
MTFKDIELVREGSIALIVLARPVARSRSTIGSTGKFQGAVRRLFRMPKPTVAAIDGAAVTIGCELALACDYRLVTERALFQESRSASACCLGSAVCSLLPRIVGLGLANEMVLRGRSVGGAEAVRIGLAGELIQPELLRARARARR